MRFVQPPLIQRDNCSNPGTDDHLNISWFPSVSQVLERLLQNKPLASICISVTLQNNRKRLKQQVAYNNKNKIIWQKSYQNLLTWFCKILCQDLAIFARSCKLPFFARSCKFLCKDLGMILVRLFTRVIVVTYGSRKCLDEIKLKQH